MSRRRTRQPPIRLRRTGVAADAPFPVSLRWHRIIRSHRDLNEVKFTIIHDLEEQLPAAVFAHECRLVNQGKGRTYRPVTDIERLIP